MLGFDDIISSPRKKPHPFVDDIKLLPAGTRGRARKYYKKILEATFLNPNGFIDQHSHVAIGRQKQHSGNVIPVVPHLQSRVAAVIDYHYPSEEIHKVLRTHDGTGLENYDLQSETDRHRAASIVANNVHRMSPTTQVFQALVAMEYGAHELAAQHFGIPKDQVTAAQMMSEEIAEDLDARIRRLSQIDPTGEFYLRARNVRAMVMTNDLPDELEENHREKYPYFPPSARIDDALARVAKPRNERGFTKAKQVVRAIEEFFDYILDQHYGVYAAASLPSTFMFEKNVSRKKVTSILGKKRRDITAADINAYQSFVMQAAFERVRAYQDVPFYIFAGVDRKAFPTQIDNGGRDFGGQVNYQHGYLPLFNTFPDQNVLFKPYSPTNLHDGIAAAGLAPNQVWSPIWWHGHDVQAAVQRYSYFMSRAPAEAWTPWDSDAYTAVYVSKLDVLFQAYAIAAAERVRNESEFDRMLSLHMDGPLQNFRRLERWGMDLGNQTQ